MNKIYLVYQDCALCGDKGRVRKLEIQEAFDKGYEVVKMPFTNPIASELIHKAVFKHEIGKMPFYTDGEKFGYNIDDVIAKPKKKRVTKRVKAEKEAEDGADVEAE